MRRRGDEEEFYKDRVTFVETKEFEVWRDALFFRGFGLDADAEEGERSRRRSTSNVQRYSRYNALVVDVSAVAGNDLELTCISLVKEFLALNKHGSGDDDGDDDGDSNGDGDDENDNSCRVVIVKSASLHDLARRLFHAQKLFAGVQSLNAVDAAAGTTSIIGTVGVEEYRRTIPYTVRKGDAVLEVGSHFGTTTTMLHDAARGEGQDSDAEPDLSGGCIGVDVGPQIIESAKKKFPNVPFAVGDAWKTADLARLKPKYLKEHAADKSYDVVYVDVGGLSGSEGLLEAMSLLSSIANSLEPRCIVIKSLCMRRLASSLMPFSEIWKKERLKKEQ